MRRGIVSTDPTLGFTTVREYRPDARVHDSAWEALTHLVAEFIHFRSHIVMMFAQEFRSSYRGTRLGVFWNFFLPLLPIFVYMMLATFRVIPSFEGVPAAVAISCNATWWYLFAASVRTPIGIVQRRNAEAMKTSLPLSVAIAASFARVLFEALVRLAFVVALAVAFQAIPAATAPLALLVLLAGFSFFVSLGHIIAILNIVVPDLERVVNVVLQIGIFLSGVIFPLSAMGPLSILEIVNPFAVFVAAVRELLFIGALQHPIALAVWSFAGFVMTLLAARTFYVMEQRIRGVV